MMVFFLSGSFSLLLPFMGASVVVVVVVILWQFGGFPVKPLQHVQNAAPLILSQVENHPHGEGLQGSKIKYGVDIIFILLL